MQCDLSDLKAIIHLKGRCSCLSWRGAIGELKTWHGECQLSAPVQVHSVIYIGLRSVLSEVHHKPVGLPGVQDESSCEVPGFQALHFIFVWSLDNSGLGWMWRRPKRTEQHCNSTFRLSRYNVKMSNAECILSGSIYPICKLTLDQTGRDNLTFCCSGLGDNTSR